MSRRATPAMERAGRALTLVYAVAGLVAILAWIVRHLAPWSMNWVVIAFTLFNVPLAATLSSIVVLATLSVALMQRKRIALIGVAFTQLVGIYLGFAVLAHMKTGVVFGPLHQDHALIAALNVASLPIGILVLFLLWWMSPAFSARQRPGSWLMAAGVALAGVATTLAATVAMVEQTAPAVGGPGHFRLVIATLARAVGLGGPNTHHFLSFLPSWVPAVASLLSGLTLIATVLVFIASARMSGRWTGAQEVALRRLIQRSGRGDSLAYFATRRDKAAVFSADGSAAVTYRVLYGVSLASADPIGEPAGWPVVIGSWLAEARRYGWLPAVIGASERGARAYAAAGLQVLYLGHEAILEPSAFQLNTAAMAPVRQAVKHTKKVGVSVRLRRRWEIADDELRAIDAAAAEWRDGADRGFSMALNRTGDAADNQLLYATAHLDERLIAVLVFVPWGHRDLSLDVMRRAPDAPNGTIERLVSEVVTSPTLGAGRVSLNFSMFWRVFAEATRLGAGTAVRWRSSVLGFLDRFWQLERLYQATQRYQPRWEPRFVCYSDGVSLPWAAVAMATAEGFLPSLQLARGDQRRHLDAVELAAVAGLEQDWSHEVESMVDRRQQEGRRALLAAGVDPYPVASFRPDHTIAELFGDSASEAVVRVAGRVRRVRDHGGVAFIDLVDGVGSVQVVLEASMLGGRPALRRAVRAIGGGDLIGLTGHLGASRNGTASLLAQEWIMQAKCLRTVPWEGFARNVTRSGDRTAELIVRPDRLQSLRARSQVTAALRSSLIRHGFTEVETPILTTVHGGAAARPFRTYSNAYHRELYLRIAPELALKRLVVAGMGPIFEVGRNFRNEGIDATHNPEFTSIEAYRPFADYHDMRRLTEQVIREVATDYNGRAVLPDGNGGWIDLDGEWPAIPMLDALAEAVGRPLGLDSDPDLLLDLAREAGVGVRGEMGPGAILEALYAELVEPNTVQPTFYTDFPQETSPLTRPHRSQPGLAERWDLVVGGLELGTAYSELTDPLDQRERFTAQSIKAAAGDPEAMETDEDFLSSLEFGLPPTGGLGIGVDRLAMVVTGAPMRELIAFPFVARKADGRASS